MKKTDEELIFAYQDKDYQSLSLEELQRLETLLKLKKYETVDNPVKIEKPDITKPELGRPVDSNYSYWVSTPDYNLYHKTLDTSTYDNSELSGYFEYTSSDNGCSDAQLRSNWSVDQNFVKDIILGAVVKQSLFEICRAGWDVNSGENARVDIRIAGVWGDPQNVSSCTCLSCSTQTYQTYSITLDQLGLYGVACSFDEFKIGGAYRRSVLDSMQNKWKNYFGSQIFSALSGASPGYTETLNNTLDCNGAISGSCCTNGSDLLARILDLDARMREAGLEPSHVIMSPTIANYLKYSQTPSSPAWFESQVGIEGGVVTRIGHLEVIEYAGATTCSSATATTFAWVVCKDRSLGFAFGKYPTAEFERDAECNSTKIIMWSYFGCSVLDASSIGAVVSPNS